jgi:hypothetical protein
VLHLEPKIDPLYHIDESLDEDSTHLHLYTSTNTLSSNALFSNDMYESGSRSLYKRFGSHLDYGLVLAKYKLNKKKFDHSLIFSLLGRQYFVSKPDIIASSIHSGDINAIKVQYDEKYAAEMSFSMDHFQMTDRVWFMKDMKFTNNELLFKKSFANTTVDARLLLFNDSIYFEPNKKRYDKHFRAKIKHSLTENFSISVQNGMKFGKSQDNKPISSFKELKFKFEYSNECVIIGATIKREFDTVRSMTSADNNVHTYTVYIKIPSIK